MGNETHLPLDAGSINAVAKSLGAVVFALVRRLPAADRAAFANDLGVMSQVMADNGDTRAETLLLDLHQAAVQAARTEG